MSIEPAPGGKRPRRGIDLGQADAKFTDRFWSKVKKTDDESSCWLWQAHVNNRGYGQFTVKKGEFFGAHVVSYALATGPIAPGEVICHRCDVTACVRPSHLFIGSQSDNANDMFAKGRAQRSRGEQHLSARLTDDAVRHIRATTRTEMTSRQLAAMYGVSVRAIWRVKSGRTWRHVA